MNEKNEGHSFNKRLLKDSIHKYSNKAVFERRERYFNSEENDKQNTKKTFNKKAKFFRKEKDQKQKEDLLIPLCKTMSSFYQSENTYNILPLLDYFEKNFLTKEKKKIQHINDIICKTDKNYSEKKLFKTEISFLTTKKDKKINKYYLKNKNDNKTNIKENNKKDSNIDVLLLFQSERNQSKMQNNNSNKKLNIESYLTKEKTYYNNYRHSKTEQNGNTLEKTSEEYASYVFDNKLSKYEQSKSFREYIYKLNEQKINSYTSKAKTERFKRLDEAYQSQVEFYKDSIKSFVTSKKLLENIFTNKVGDYARYISTKREREKIKESLLRQEIMDYRKEIEQIRAKINKIEIEKKNIIKWIFLQIQMKEKKLNLPPYYKMVITSFGINKSSKRLMLRNDEGLDSSFSEKKKK